MFREFNFTSITPDIDSKKIIVTMTTMIDDKTVSQDNIRLMDCSTNCFVNISFEVIGDKIFINLIESPIPNNEYHLSIKGIKDITGIALVKGINYRVIFATVIKTEAMLITPSFSEEITDNLVFSVREYIPDKFKAEKNNIFPINSFMIEVATDNLFNNVVFDTRMENRTVMQVMTLSNGQYYARARVQNADNEYGQWGPSTTFVLNISNDKKSIIDEEDNEPVFYKPLSIIGVPKDGDDCQSFYVEFSEDIDLDNDEDIEVYRRLI